MSHNEYFALGPQMHQPLHIHQPSLHPLGLVLVTGWLVQLLVDLHLKLVAALMDVGEEGKGVEDGGKMA